MLIEDVIEILNEGKELTDLAAELGIKAVDLKRKLTNAAVEFTESTNQWAYKGVIPEKSLGRDIKKRIEKLKEDRKYIIEGEPKPTRRRNPKTCKDLDNRIVLYTDYLIIKQNSMKEKKTFNLTSEIYQTVKEISVENSMQINPLINLFIQRGLEYYQMRNRVEDEKGFA